MRDFILNVLEYFLELIYDIFVGLQYILIIILIIVLAVGPVALGVIYSPLWALLYLITIPLIQAIIDELN